MRLPAHGQTLLKRKKRDMVRIIYVNFSIRMYILSNMPCCKLNRTDLTLGNVNAGAIQAPVVKETEFPSLGAAMSVKETKKEKKKKQTMSLGEFVSGGAGGAPRADLLMSLPTGPRGRREEGEEEKPLGGAFKGYGGMLQFISTCMRKRLDLVGI